MLAALRGDLAAAHRVLADAPPERRLEVGPAVATAFLQPWLLDSITAGLLERDPKAFERDRGRGLVVRALLAWLHKDRKRVALLADSAAGTLGDLAVANPQNASTQFALGLAFALLGRKAEAMAQADRGLALQSIDTDDWEGAAAEVTVAEIATLVGDRDRAFRHLERSLSRQGPSSPGLIRVDPMLAPLRDDPRFRQLTER
jgi:serine/threonine-protein kinase